MLTAINEFRQKPPGGIGGMSFRNLKHPINLRHGTDDLGTVLDTVLREDYGKHLPNREPRSLIDAGAFIGDTSAYFLSRFPSLRTWALEPNPENFSLARINLSPYGDRATVLPWALSAQAGTMRFSGKGIGGAIVGEGGYEIQTTSIPLLLEDIPGGFVDILKMDIEGGEMDVFAGAPEVWLPKVGIIIVELHGPEIETFVLNALNRHGFNVKQFRSVWYCESPSAGA